MKRSVETIRDSKQGFLVDGKWCQPECGNYIESFDPATGKVWYELSQCGEADVARAVDAAHEALHDPTWRRISQTQRGKLLQALANLITENAETLAQIETQDNGKLLREMRAQLTILPDYYGYYAGIADKIQGETIPLNRLDVLNYTVREPIGVVGIIVPWNSPLYLLANSLAPCLAVGNTVVIKPSEHTTASTLAFAELVEEAGFPPGVVNVVSGYGSETGVALTNNPTVSKISFVGSTQTGEQVAAAAVKHHASTHLELGGKSPHVVFDDANPERAALGIIAGIFAAAGQTCIAGSRAFVHRKLHDEIVDRIVDRTEKIVIGNPINEETELGPLALKDQLHKVHDFIASGIADGAQLVSGGKSPDNPSLADGWFVEPTVFTGVDNEMRIAREEIFGPVLGIIPFDDEAELIRLANDTNYGLAAGIWTSDIDRALRFARDVDAGTIWINTYRAASFMSPAGGFKHSGHGKQNGYESIREYSRLKSVLIDYSGETQDPFVMRLR